MSGNQTPAKRMRHPLVIDIVTTTAEKHGVHACTKYYW